MNYRNLNSVEGRTYLEKALILETSGAESKTVSRRIANVIANMDTTNVNPNVVNFIIAKRIIHEALLDHYVVPQNTSVNNMLPSNVENDRNVNLDTEESKLITFSNADVQCFVSKTNKSIKQREEKFDELHTRIRQFLLGKKVGSRTETPVVDPDEEPEYPAWWANV